MSAESPGMIFLNACLINNFVLSMFLGICPFLGVSGNVSNAGRMGLAVTAVMLFSSACAYAINLFLVAIGAPYLRLIAYIVVIASAVQIVELVVRRFSEGLYRALGIFLPLITTNCAILGVALFQTNRGYDLVQSLFFAGGAGVGFTIALLIMSGLREELDLASPPRFMRGTALALAIAGILAMAFSGFGGLGG